MLIARGAPIGEMLTRLSRHFLQDRVLLLWGAGSLNPLSNPCVTFFAIGDKYFILFVSTHPPIFSTKFTNPNINSKAKKNKLNPLFTNFLCGSPPTLRVWVQTLQIKIHLQETKPDIFCVKLVLACQLLPMVSGLKLHKNLIVKIDI